MTTQSQIVELVIQVTDKGTVVVRKASKELKKYDEALRKSNKSSATADKTSRKTAKSVGKLGTEAEGTSKKVAKSTRNLDKFQKSAKKTGTVAATTGKQMGKMHRSAGGLTAAVGTLALALGVLAFPAIKAARFERSMSEVKAISGATAGEFKLMSDEARRLGAVTEYSATQAASGLKYLTMAGLNASQATQALGGVLNLAQAGAMDLGRAADIATNILTGFGMSVSELGHVNDVLAQTFTNTNSTLEELGYALSYVAPVAAGLGADFEDLVASLGLLHSAGIKGCYDRQTDVLTLAGWKKWEDVTLQDEFATYNDQTGNLEYQKASRLIRYKYKGKMYKVSNKGVNLCVTPDHRMYVKPRSKSTFRILTAEQVKGTVNRYKTGGIGWVGSGLKTIILPGFKQNRGSWVKDVKDANIDSKVWATFLGWYISEGSCDCIKGSYRIIISQRKPNHLKKMWEVLSKLPYKVRYEKGRGFVILSQQLYNAVVELGTVYEKHIPKYAKSWGPELLSALYTALLEGDGDQNSTYYTSSIKLRDDVQEICLKLGYAASNTCFAKAGSSNVMRDGRVVTARVDQWRVNVTQKRTEPWFAPYEYTGVHGNRNTGTRHELFEGWVDYDDEVFCAEVPNHLLIVRRKGRSIVSGNSMAGTTLRGVMTRLTAPTKMAQKVMDELGRRIGGLGLQIVNSEGKFVGFVSLVKQLEKAGATTTEIIRMLGQRAGPGLAALLSQGSEAIARMTKLNEESAGRAKLIAKIMHENTVGAFIALKSAMEETAIVIGNVLLPALKKMAEGLQAIIKWIGIAAKESPILTKVIITLTASFAGLLAVTLLLGGALASATWAVTGLRNAVKHLGKFLGVTSAATAGLVVTLIALVATLGALTFSGDFRKWVSGFDLFGKTLGEWGASATAGIVHSFEMLRMGISLVFQSLWIVPKTVLSGILIAIGKFGGAVVTLIGKVPGLGKLLGWDKDTAGIKKVFTQVEQAGKNLAQSTLENYAKTATALKNQDTIGKGVLNQIAKERIARKELIALEQDYESVKGLQLQLSKDMAEAETAINSKYKIELDKLTAARKTANEQMLTQQKILAQATEQGATMMNGLGASIQANAIDIWDNLNKDTAVVKYTEVLDALKRETTKYGVDNSAEMAKAGTDLMTAKANAITAGLGRISGLYDKELTRFEALHAAELNVVHTSAADKKAAEDKYTKAVSEFSEKIYVKKKDYFKKATIALKSELDASYALEKNIAQKIIDLQEDIKNSKLSTEEKVRALKRKAMSDEQVFQDKTKEYNELMAKAADAVGVSYTDVKKYATQAQGVAADLVRTSKAGIVSVDDAISKTQAAQELMTKAATAQDAVLDASLGNAKANTESLAATFDTVRTKFEEFSKKVSAGIISKVILDTTDLDAQIVRIENQAPITLKAVIVFDTANAAQGALLDKINKEKEKVLGDLEVSGTMEIMAQLEQVQGLKEKISEELVVNLKKGDDADAVLLALGETTGILEEIRGPTELKVESPELSELKEMLVRVSGETAKIGSTPLKFEYEHRPIALLKEDLKDLPTEGNPKVVQLIADVDNEDAFEEVKQIVTELKDPIEMEITVGGLQAAITGITNLLAEIAKIKDKHFTIYERHVQARQTGGPLHASTGRQLPGYGGGDKNLLMAEDGEWVIRKEAVRKYGHSFMAALNGMRIPGFSVGGGISGAVASQNSVKPAVNNPLQNFGKVDLSVGQLEIPAILSNDVFKDVTDRLTLLKRFGT